MRDIDDLVCPSCGRSDLLPTDLVEEGLVIACAICQHEWILVINNKNIPETEEERRLETSNS